MTIYLRLFLLGFIVTGSIISNGQAFAGTAKQNDPGPYKIPLKPVKNPVSRVLDTPIPPDVEAAIKAAPKTQDVFSVTESRQPFEGQILKVETLAFQQGTALVLTNFNVPWVAIVAKTVKFVEPESNNSITAEANWQPKRYFAPDTSAPPASAPKAGQCANGGPGTNGAPGGPGHVGDSGPVPPKVYFIAGELVNKFNKPLPQSLNFIFDARGYSGGDGGPGGTGGTGGAGGDGGPADWHDPGTYPFDPGCKCGAGFGGPGSTGGRGGLGGIGGDASPGADLMWIGPAPVLESLSYTRNFLQGGLGGKGNFSGVSGISGRGGARGEHAGGCGGGGRGGTPATQATPSTKANSGANKPAGKIYRSVEDNVGRFY